MNENDNKTPVEKVFVTNKNYEKYYNEKRKEEEERLAKRKAKLNEATRLKTPGGRPRPLLQSEIESMQKQARSAKECARMLGVSYPTYKKYAKMYGVFDNLKNESGVGIPKFGAGMQRGRVTHFDRVLQGECPSYPNWKIKRNLIAGGYVPKCCSNCGYDEERVTDSKVPLLLDYVDGNRRNHLFDNLRFLCYNCWFQINGDLFGKAMRNVKRDAWDYQYLHK